MSDEQARICGCGTEPIPVRHDVSPTRTAWACRRCGVQGPSYPEEATATLAWNRLQAVLQNEQPPVVITCVWCGHAFPPGTPQAGHDMLFEHAKTCSRHPVRALEQQLEAATVRARNLEALLQRVRDALTEQKPEWARALTQKIDAAAGKLYVYDWMDAVLKLLNGILTPSGYSVHDGWDKTAQQALERHRAVVDELACLKDWCRLLVADLERDEQLEDVCRCRPDDPECDTTCPLCRICQLLQVGRPTVAPQQPNAATYALADRNGNRLRLTQTTSDAVWLTIDRPVYLGPEEMKDLILGLRRVVGDLASRERKAD